MLRYCVRCVYPDSKPDLFIDAEGVCSACRAFEQRKAIDYPARKQELLAILEKYRSKDGSNYDVLIPGSGGKDSTYAALQIKELGFNPLIVTVTTDHLTEIGRKNIENLKDNGFDYIEVTPNPVVRRKINKFCLETVGDISWPEHLLIFTAPVREAVQRNIPLLIWGENSQHEYGGPASAATSNVLDRKWLEEFGGLNGLRVSDVQEMLGADSLEMIPYHYPADTELKRVGVTGLFLGYYLPWDGAANAAYATAHGFTRYHKFVEGSLFDYENLDNAQTGIHDFFRWLKFGYGRSVDIACNMIRRDRMTREEGLKAVKEFDGVYPSYYLGVTLKEILDRIGMTKEEFDRICERFRNKKIHADKQSHSHPAVPGS